MVSKLVQESDEGVPVITSLGTTKKNSVVVNEDDFAVPAEAIKALSGVSTVAKRRVSYELKKFYRGDGAESKAINEKTFLTGYQVLDVIEPPHNLAGLAKLYEMSAPHYAAVNAKVANIVGLGYNLVETNLTKRNLEHAATLKNGKKKVDNLRKELSIHKDEINEKLESFNEEDTLSEVFQKVWRDYEVTGNGYIEVGRKKDGRIGYVGHIPSQTIRIRRERDGYVQVSGSEVQFFANFGQAKGNPIGDGKPNEIIHIKKYSPTSGYYGVPDVIAATSAIAGNKFSEQYNLDYFENKAMPKYIITLKGAKLGAQAESSLLAFFESSAQSGSQRSLYIPLPADTPDNRVELKVQPVEAKVQDSSFNNYRKSNLADILMAHRVPITKISIAEGASLAVARDADKTFKEQVATPNQRDFEKKVGRIVKELTDAFELKFNEMTLTDENTQSQIDERRRKTGVETANEQRVRRGMSTIEGGDELFDMNKSSAASEQRADNTAIRDRDSQRSAGRTDSIGEGRSAQGDGPTVAG